MKNKKQKWEVLFEDYSNGGLDKKIKELEDKHSIEIKNKKDTKEKGETTKSYVKQKKQLEKIKGNLPKIQNLIEFKDTIASMKTEIDDEIKSRESISKLSQIKAGLDKENEALMAKVAKIQKKLKSKDISAEDKKKLQEELQKTSMKCEENNETYVKTTEGLKQAEQKNGKFEKFDKEDLKMMSNKLSIQSSKVNFYANRLMKGYSIEAIKVSDKTTDWSMKAKGKEAEKTKNLKNATKKNGKIDLMTEEELAADVKKIMAEKKKEEEKGMVKVSEFDQKHPRLAKIKNFFSNIKNKVFNSKKKNEEAEKKETKEQTIDKHKKFVKVLKDMDQYEIFDVAEKGMDGIKEDRMSEAKKKLMENKQKSAEESKAKYEQGLNDYYKSHNINKTKVDNTDYIDR